MTDIEDEARAEAILANGGASGDEVGALEERLARRGRRDVARALHTKRLALDVARARAILSGESSRPGEPLSLAKRLLNDKWIGLARRILLPALDKLVPADKGYRSTYQKATLATYKDPDLPLGWRLDEALRILERAEDLSASTQPESLGLAGAIYKRKWLVDSDRQHLERALFYYMRGYAQSVPGGQSEPLAYLRANPECVFDATKDQGYTGINAAYLLDVIAGLEDDGAARAGLISRAAAERRDGARLIRDEIIRSVPALADATTPDWLMELRLNEKWWFYATVGEAYFGLGRHDPTNYDRAVEWLVDRPAAAGLQRRAGGQPSGALDIPEWEFESTARQLADLAVLQLPAGVTEAEFEASPAGKALGLILKGDHEAVRSAFRGRVGLALSGGGFRAALFHIGVLACLAERDVLKHVEVLSCVSGGSIVGAHYYLELRHLFGSKADAVITADDYVEIVERMSKDFLRGVQRNIRTRVLAEWTTNLKLLLLPGYSRTLRVGELYERELYRHVRDGAFTGHPLIPDWIATRLGHRRRRWLDDAQIHPLGPNGTPDTSFQPRNHNWRRENKVPALILNATSLNTGHCWQFTSTFMGEPPTPINAELDANERLRRMYYQDAPLAHRRVRLGHAVAASSGVPGLFEPLALDGLYPNRTVKLVDGGVCDNQGAWSLLEQDCTVALVSDASGQMESLAVPSSGLLGVPLRANNILQARVREAQYTDVAQRRRSKVLRGLMFIHLKRDLSNEQVAWTDCPADRTRSDFEARREAHQSLTSYGIATDAQRKLAAIRTDLDSFSDIEAHALMASGYRMTAEQFDEPSPCVAGFGRIVKAGRWDFLRPEMLNVLRPDALAPGISLQRRHAYRVLDVGASIAFKIWRLSPALQVGACLTAVLAVSALVGGLGWLFYSRWNDTIAATIAISAVGRQLSALTFGTVGLYVCAMVVPMVAGAVLGRLVGPRYAAGILKTIRWRDTIRTVAKGVAMATVGFLIARIHLHVFDRLFLHRGRADSIR
jgi:predicted acylesterase/phospholipase RssA